MKPHTPHTPPPSSPGVPAANARPRAAEDEVIEAVTEAEGEVLRAARPRRQAPMPELGVTIDPLDSDPLEEARAWWDKNGRSVLIMAAVLVLGLGAAEWWREHRAHLADRRTAALLAVVEPASPRGEGVPAEPGDIDVEALKTLLAEVPAGHMVWVLAQMNQAAQQLAAGDAAAAVAVLEQTRTEAAGRKAVAPVLPLLRLRLARAHWAAGQIDSALAVLGEGAGEDTLAWPPAWRPLMLELRGSLLFAKGDLPAARAAWAEGASLPQAGDTLRSRLGLLRDSLPEEGASPPVPNAAG